jgi:hypothetical protein
MRPAQTAIALVTSIVVIGIATACTGVGTDDEATKAVPASTGREAAMRTAALRCRRAPRSAVATIALGLRRGDWLTSARFVVAPLPVRNAQGWPEWFVAARVGGAVGVWATSRGGDGPLMAIDHVSATSTLWGAGAQPTSQAWKLHARLRATPAAEAAAACVRS